MYLEGKFPDWNVTFGENSLDDLFINKLMSCPILNQIVQHFSVTIILTYLTANRGVRILIQYLTSFRDSDWSAAVLSRLQQFLKNLVSIDCAWCTRMVAYLGDKNDISLR